MLSTFFLNLFRQVKKNLQILLRFSRPLAFRSNKYLLLVLLILTLSLGSIETLAKTVTRFYPLSQTGFFDSTGVFATAVVTYNEETKESKFVGLADCQSKDFGDIMKGILGASDFTGKANCTGNGGAVFIKGLSSGDKFDPNKINTYKSQLIMFNDSDIVKSVTIDGVKYNVYSNGQHTVIQNQKNGNYFINSSTSNPGETARRMREDTENWLKEGNRLTVLNAVSATEAGVNLTGAQQEVVNQAKQKAQELQKKIGNDVVCKTLLGKDNIPIFSCKTKDGKQVGPDGKEETVSACEAGDGGDKYFTLDANNNFSACVSKEDIQRAVNSVANRGPDERNISTDGGGGNGAADLFDFVLDVTAYLLIGILYFLGWIAIVVLWGLMNMVLLFLSINPAGATFIEVAKQPWQIVVGIANLITLFSFLVVGFGYLLDIKKFKVGIEQFLLNLIIFTVALNFTLLGSATFVNIGHGLGNVVIGAFTGGQGEKKLVNSFIASIAQVSIMRCHGAGSNNCSPESGDGAFELIQKEFGNVGEGIWQSFQDLGSDLQNGGIGLNTTKMVMEAAFLLIVCFAIWQFWRVLWLVMIRTIGLWLLIVASPLALAFKLSPIQALQKYGDEWVDKFWKLAVFYPAFAFGLVLTGVMMQAFGAALNSQYNNLASRGAILSENNLQVLAQEVQRGDKTSELFLFLAVAIMGAVVGMAILGALADFFEKSFNSLAGMALKGLQSAWKSYSTLSSVGGGIIRGTGKVASGGLSKVGSWASRSVDTVTGGQLTKFRQNWQSRITNLKKDIDSNNRLKEQKLQKIQQLEREKEQVQERMQKVRQRIAQSTKLTAAQKAKLLADADARERVRLATKDTEINRQMVDIQASEKRVSLASGQLRAMEAASKLAPDKWSRYLDNVFGFAGGIVEFTPTAIEMSGSVLRSIPESFARHSKARSEAFKSGNFARISAFLRKSGIADKLKEWGVYDIDTSKDLGKYFTGMDQAAMQAVGEDFIKRVVTTVERQAMETALNYSKAVMQNVLTENLKQMQKIWAENKDRVEKGAQTLEYKDKSGVTRRLGLGEFQAKYLRLLEQAVNDQVAARIAFGTVEGRDLMRNERLGLYYSLSSEAQQKITEDYLALPDDLAEQRGREMSLEDYKKTDTRYLTGPGLDALKRGLAQNGALNQQIRREKEGLDRVYTALALDYARSTVNRLDREDITRTNLAKFVTQAENLLFQEGNPLVKRQLIRSTAEEFAKINLNNNLSTAEKEIEKRKVAKDLYYKSFAREYGLTGIGDSTSAQDLVNIVNSTNLDDLKNSNLGRLVANSISEWDALSEEQQDKVLRRVIKEAAIANLEDREINQEKLYTASNAYNAAVKYANDSVYADNAAAKLLEKALSAENIDFSKFISKSNADLVNYLGAQIAAKKIKEKAVLNGDLSSEGFSFDVFGDLDERTRKKLSVELSAAIAKLAHSNFQNTNDLQKVLTKIEQARSLASGTLNNNTNLSALTKNLQSKIASYGGAKIDYLNNLAIQTGDYTGPIQTLAGDLGAQSKNAYFEAYKEQAKALENIDSLALGPDAPVGISQITLPTAVPRFGEASNIVPFTRTERRQLDPNDPNSVAEITYKGYVVIDKSGNQHIFNSAKELIEAGYKPPI